MYKLEVYKDLELIKVINFTNGEDLEMLQYKEGYQAKGYTVQIWRLYDYYFLNYGIKISY